LSKRSLERLPDDIPLRSRSIRPTQDRFLLRTRGDESSCRSIPQDLDVQTLYAEAMMNVTRGSCGRPMATGTRHGGNLGDARSGSGSRSRASRGQPLFSARHRSLAHPERATAAAERLKTLMPAADTCCTWPAHIMQRIGRYEDAAEANRRAPLPTKNMPGSRGRPTITPSCTRHTTTSSWRTQRDGGAQVGDLDAVKDSRRIVSDEMLLAMPEWTGIWQRRMRHWFGSDCG